MGAKADVAIIDLDGLGHFIQTDGAAIGEKARCATHFFDHFQRCDATGHVDKIFCLTGNVEAHVVTLQQAADNLTAPWQDVEHIRRWEVGVVEEGDSHIRAQFAQVGRYHPQVVVVNPDGGVLRGFGSGPLGEHLVHFQEHFPVFFLEAGPFPEGVQGGPEGFLGKALVEDVDVVLVQGYPRRNQIGVAAAIHFRVGLKRFRITIMGRPRYPGARLGIIKEAQQRRNDTVGRFGAVTHHLAVDDGFFVGQAVIDDHQIGLARSGNIAHFGVHAGGAEKTKVTQCFQDAAATR